ncbi:MAG: lipase family protein [Verrucomicrobia bacterium]|nr:lipase family protein [Verrucomicrobiota bacterium]MCF7708626.1 lipase family protein [Verrucomicrobiota bacterium]
MRDLFIFRTVLRISNILVGSAVLAITACFCAYGASGENLEIISAEKVDQGLELKWSGVSGAEGYRVEYKETLGTGEWLPAGDPDAWPIQSTQWVDDGFISDSMRFYRVVALLSEVERGKLISSEQIDSYSLLELGLAMMSFDLPVDPEYSVETHRIVYETIDANGDKTTATGAIAIPQGLSDSAPMVGYQHGTVFRTNNVPSSGDGLDYMIGVGFGSLGYIAAIPDYLGLGGSDGLHPYLHAKSEATAAIDMLRAARQLVQDSGDSWNSELFLAGYSQGGQATMAVHREIETYHSNEFNIVASAPMAGPYDMSGTMYDVIMSDQEYVSPSYLPYTLFSYQDVYGIYDDITNALKSPYSSTLPPLFDGTHSGGDIDDEMPGVPKEIFNPEYLSALETNPEHPLRQALADNDLYNWVPQAPMHLYHCAGDDTVPYANSQVAYDSFIAAGAEDVELIDPMPSAGHAEGTVPCASATLLWFESLR